MTDSAAFESVDIYADGPTLDEIESLGRGRVCGYTFNPTLFRALKVTDYLGHCRKVLEACGDAPVSLEVIADDADGMIRQARILSGLSQNVYVKIPITFTSGKSTRPVVEALAERSVKLNITAIFTKEQSIDILPPLRDQGAIISVFSGRLFDVGIDAVEATRAIADYVHAESDGKVLWASPRMVYDIKNAALANCDIITMQSALIKKCSLFGKLPEEYSLETVKMFYHDAVDSKYEL